MDINSNNQNGFQEGEHKTIGPVIGALIIVILLIAAALYVWSQKLNKDNKVVVPNTVASQEASMKKATDTVESLGNDADKELEKLDDLNF